MKLLKPTARDYKYKNYHATDIKSMLQTERPMQTCLRQLPLTWHRHLGAAALALSTAGWVGGCKFGNIIPSELDAEAPSKVPIALAAADALDIASLQRRSKSNWET